METFPRLSQNVTFNELNCIHRHVFHLRLGTITMTTTTQSSSIIYLSAMPRVIDPFAQWCGTVDEEGKGEMGVKAPKMGTGLEWISLSSGEPVFRVRHAQ